MTTTVEGRNRFTVNVRYAEDFRSSIDRIREVLIPLPAGSAPAAAQVELGALADVMIASRPEADAKVREAARAHGGLEELRPGATFGSFVIVRKLGEGPRGAVYAARQGEADRTLKILRPDVTRDASAVGRFLAAVRLAAKVKA